VAVPTNKEKYSTELPINAHMGAKRESFLKGKKVQKKIRIKNSKK